jgi:hypothetical protein
MSNSRKLERVAFLKILVGTQQLLALGQSAIAKQISKNWREFFFLSHNLVKHYVSTILQKEEIRNVAKKSQYIC